MKLIFPRSTRRPRHSCVDESEHSPNLLVDVIDGVSYPRPAPFPCPLCGQINRLRRVVLSTGMRIPIAECVSCRLAYQSPRPSEEAALAYATWRGSLAGEQSADAAGEPRATRERLARIQDLRPAAGRLLDCKSPSECFVDACRAAGWDAVRSDGAPENADRATRPGDSAQQEAAERFDVITLWNVIERLADPLGVLRGLHDRLAEQGMLIIETANYESWQRVAEGGQWGAYRFEHQFHFSPASLEAITWRAGFRHFRVLDGEHAKPALGQLFTRPPRALDAWKAYLGAMRAWPGHGDTATMIGVARV